MAVSAPSFCPFHSSTVHVWVLTPLTPLPPSFPWLAPGCSLLIKLGVAECPFAAVFISTQLLQRRTIHPAGRQQHHHPHHPPWTPSQDTNTTSSPSTAHLRTFPIPSLHITLGWASPYVVQVPFFFFWRMWLIRTESPLQQLSFLGWISLCDHQLCRIPRRGGRVSSWSISQKQPDRDMQHDQWQEAVRSPAACWALYSYWAQMI